MTELVKFMATETSAEVREVVMKALDSRGDNCGAAEEGDIQ